MNNKDSRLKMWFPVIGALLLVCGLWLGFLLAGGSHLSPAQEKLQRVFDLIADEYVDEVDRDSLVEKAIPELLRNLDPHSVYIPVNELDMANRDLESSFYGVGIQFQLMADSVCVVEVISGGPAERMGLRAGDRIVEADGVSLTGEKIDNETVMRTLRGQKDTVVRLKVKRNGSPKLLTFDVTRGEIPSVSVDAAYMVEDGIGYIRVNKFAGNTYNEFLQNINSLRAKGAKSFILDLRGNTGGLLDQAILMANEFLPAGSSIVNVRGRHSSEDVNWLADGMGVFTNEPLVVLTDEFSASSSEIVAGAMQDNDRGLIVGRRSFGKGLVQRQIVLPDSSQIRLTVQRYYTPSGRCIQKQYTGGENDTYRNEILDRYSNGELFSADSIKVDSMQVFNTMAGRKVYGGGGIIPDVFVPGDTTGVTSYYLSVANAGLLNRFAYEYADLNRSDLEKAKDIKSLERMLPPSSVLLMAFVNYARDNGIAPRWYYINISATLIVNQLRALIARDILGMNAYFEIVNATDPVVREAVTNIHKGVDKAIMSTSK